MSTLQFISMSVRSFTDPPTVARQPIVRYAYTMSCNISHSLRSQFLSNYNSTLTQLVNNFLVSKLLSTYTFPYTIAYPCTTPIHTTSGLVHYKGKCGSGKSRAGPSRGGILPPAQ